MYKTISIHQDVRHTFEPYCIDDISLKKTSNYRDIRYTISMEYDFKNLSLLIAEDEPTTRELLNEALRDFFSFVYVANDGCDALSMIEKHRPDIVLSDINMPCLNGYEFVKLAKERHLSPLFVFITANSDSDSMLDAIDISIDAYIVKPVDIRVLMQKIQSLLDKKDRDDNIDQFLNEVLSDRELKVFLDIAKGISPNTIALTYSIKPQTVSTYRQRILEKMNMNNNSDIIRYAIKHNLI